jgi:hypothetical protein
MYIIARVVLQLILFVSCQAGRATSGAVRKKKGKGKGKGGKGKGKRHAEDHEDEDDNDDDS